MSIVGADEVDLDRQHISWLSPLAWVQVASESQQELEHLDLGEREAISLALRVSADLVLRTSGEDVRSLVTAAWECHARCVCSISLIGVSSFAAGRARPTQGYEFPHVTKSLQTLSSIERSLASSGRASRGLNTPCGAPEA